MKTIRVRLPAFHIWVVGTADGVMKQGEELPVSRSLQVEVGLRRPGCQRQRNVVPVQM